MNIAWTRRSFLAATLAAALGSAFPVDRRRADQDRPRHRALRPVGARRRGHHARPDDRHRRAERGGGVLGRKFELVRRDDEATPAKGVIAARELVFKEKVAVLFGGLDTPVSLAIVPIMNQAKVPFMGPWAAGTPITKNGANPNYVFRVSAVDEIVDKAMLQYAQKNFGTKKPGLILINNPWGESNEKGLRAAMAAKNVTPAGIEKFENNDVDVVPQLTRLKEGRRRHAVHGGQRRPLGAGGQVARSHGLAGADRFALGACRRTLHRARRAEREERALRADLQLLRQPAPGRPEGDEDADGQVSGHQGSGRRHPGGRRGERLRRDAPGGAGDRERRLHRRRRRSARASTRSAATKASSRPTTSRSRQRCTTRSRRTTTSGRSSSATRSCRSA